MADGDPFEALKVGDVTKVVGVVGGMHDESPSPGIVNVFPNVDVGDVLKLYATPGHASLVSGDQSVSVTFRYADVDVPNGAFNVVLHDLEDDDGLLVRVVGVDVPWDKKA